MKQRFVVFTLLILLLSCNSKQIDNASQPQPTPETSQMIKRLNSIIAHQDPMKNHFRNHERLSLLEQITDPTVSIANINGRSKLANEQLRAGASQQAAENFAAMLTLMQQHPQVFNDVEQQKIRKKLAIAHLRTGEQNNCVMLHGKESCLFPLSKAAVHLNQEGAKKATQQLITLLEASPDNLHLQWLLNLATQTIGQYPHAVPQQWRIDMDFFASDVSMPTFTNIAPSNQSNVIDLAGGSITEDFNNDGWIDIITSAWGHNSQIRLLLNDGSGQFIDATQSAGLTRLNGGLNMISADYDNDGDVDVFVMRGAWRMNNGKLPNSLLRNDGQGFFSDVTDSSGLLSFHPTQTAAWADFDNDGWLDLLIGNESVPGNPHLTELYHNNQNGGFTEVSKKAGLHINAYVKGVVWGDYNNDGRMDIYVSNLGHPNQLFRNDSNQQEWRFTEVSQSAGVEQPLNSFTTWFWDFDNDGWLDLFVGDYNTSAYTGQDTQDSQTSLVIKGLMDPSIKANSSRLYRNNKDGTFTDDSKRLSINYPLLIMGANYEDIDNDGFLDMYIGTGEPDFATLIPNKMFRNNAGVNFQDITTTSGVGHLQKGHAISFADIDNDGDQDIYAVMGGAYSGDSFQNALFENPGHDNHWLNITLIGHQSNRSAIGAKIVASIKDQQGSERKIHRVVGSGGSFGANSLSVNIGLHKANQVHSLQVIWPSGHVSNFENIQANQFIQIAEQKDTLDVLNKPQLNHQTDKASL